jgi:hypothetical protein
LFETKLPAYRPDPIRIYVKSEDTTQRKSRDLPSKWGPGQRKKWEKFCERKRKEGRRIIAERDENERKRPIWLRSRKKPADYFWEWKTDTSGEGRWMFVRDEDWDERDEVWNPQYPDEMKGPKLRAKDEAKRKRGGTQRRIVREDQEEETEGFGTSQGRRLRARSDKSNYWIHWRDKYADIGES